MSWTKTVHIECDAGDHGCMQQPAHIEHDENVADARATVAQNGWKYEDQMDICPSCVYVRETGCECDTQLHEGGEMVRLKDEQASRGCKIHDSRLQRNSRAAQR